MKRAFLLMEVVVAVGILVMGLAFIGMQIQNSSRSARRAERSMRTLLLAESTFSEFDAGLIIPDGEETEREYGPLFPDYGWRLLIDPHPTTADLNQVTLEILHQVRLDFKDEFDFDEAEVVQRLYTLRVTPPAIDLTRDFGMDQEQADELAEQLATVTEDGIDPYNLDPALFGTLDQQELLDLLTQAPQLLEALGLGLNNLEGLSEELRQALEQAQAEVEGTTGEGGEQEGGSGRRPRRGGGRRPRDRSGVR